MWDAPYFYWLLFGAILIFAEFILPGLVSMFVGLGALTVAALLYWDQIQSLPEQFIWFFASSIFYIFSLRLIVMEYYPSDTDCQDLDEDAAVFGQLVKVVEAFDKEGIGRISHSGTTWRAKLVGFNSPQPGEEVEIIGRDNITWIVEKPVA